MKSFYITILFFLFLSNTYAQVRDFYKSSADINLQKKGTKIPVKERNTDKQLFTQTCITMEMDTLRRKKFPRTESLDDFEQSLQIEISKRKNFNGRTQGVIYTIPVIVHIVHNGQSIGVGENISAAQVYSQIEVLNEDFRKKIGTPGFNTHPAGSDMEIEFTPALYDPNGVLLPEPGIRRINGGRSGWEGADIENSLKPQTIWNTSKYFNVWTVRFTGSYGSVLGYAQFPSLSNLSGLNSSGGSALTDGVVCRFDAFGRVGNLNPSFNKGRTMTHEAGHWLGLRHIWGDVNNCSHPQDYCDDTPPVRERTTGCPTGKNTCVFANDAPDMIENYMDYTSDACMNIFTQNQKTRMRTVLEVSPRRKELLISNVQIPTNKPLAFFDADKVTVCSGTNISFLDKSQNTPTTWQWDFFNSSGTVVGTFYAQNPLLTFNTAGIYDVRLIATNGAGKDTLLKRNYINVLSSTNLTLPFNETVENTTTSAVLPGWIIYNPDKDKSWQIATNASGFGTGSRSIVFDNYDPTIDLKGKIDALMSNKLNLSTAQNLQLNFDIAYAQYDNDYNDTLALYFSTDCGATFTPFWFKGGKDLATAPNTTSPFLPGATQWRTENISLNFLNGNSSVYIAFGNISGWGNRMFLDNIRFTVPTITQAPVARFYASNTNVCVGETVQFNDNSTNTPTAWSWQFQGGTPATSVLQHPRIKYDNPGTFNVQLTSTNNLGSNTQILSSYINVIPKPILSISANNQTICDGDSIKLTGTGGLNYIWYDDRQNIIGSGETIWVYPRQNTTFSLTGENAAGCKNIQTISVSVNGIPQKPIISLNGIALQVTPVNGITYQWYSTNGLIAGANGSSYLPNSNGTYFVIAKNANNCTVKSDPYNYVITSTGTEITGNNNALILFPNPAKDKLRLKIRGAGEVTLSTLLGARIIKASFNNEILLDVSSFNRGTYVAEISTGSFIFRKLVLIQ
jgi:PKD repeat protein